MMSSVIDKFSLSCYHRVSSCLISFTRLFLKYTLSSGWSWVTIATYLLPLKHASILLWSSLCYQFWIADTWHVTKWSWWLSWYLSQINVKEVCSSPPSTAYTTSLALASASYTTRLDKSKHIGYQPRRITLDTHNCSIRDVEQSSCSRILLVPQLRGRECKASVRDTYCICHSNCRNMEINRVYVRRHLQHVD
jgi:hypothetical protein